MDSEEYKEESANNIVKLIGKKLAFLHNGHDSQVSSNHFILLCMRFTMGVSQNHLNIFSHPVIEQLCRIHFYQNTTKIGARFPEHFADELPREALALLFMVVSYFNSIQTM